MPAPDTISTDKLSRLIGLPKCPVLIDVRIDEDFAADPCLIPAAQRRRAADVMHWAPGFTGPTAIVVCHQGHKLSHGVAAVLRHHGVPAEVLEGGFEAWRQAQRPTVIEGRIPPRDAHGRTMWVTRARPKIDRIACPWLIRRFVDPQAMFLFVAPTEVAGVVERFGATPFDVEGVAWSHRGEACSFDTMLDEFGLDCEPLRRLAAIVRGADTARFDLAPEAAGLLAMSLGLSRMYSSDLEQLDAGLLVYDALYRWCRDAVEETHNWPTNKPAASV